MVVGQSKVVSACSASLATSTSTGPGRPVEAMWKASARVRGMSAGSVTRKLCLVIGIVMPRMSASWKASVPIAALGTGPLLVPDQDVPDPGGVHQRVVQREDRAAGDAEDGLYPGGLQRADEALGSGDLVGHLTDLSGGAGGCGQQKTPRSSVDSRGVARSADGRQAARRRTTTRDCMATASRRPSGVSTTGTTRLSTRAGRSAADGALGGRADQLHVLREHPGRVDRRQRLPAGPAAVQLVVVDQQVQ